MEKKWNNVTPGIPDEMFVRGNVPMTKEEIRAITMSKLRINRDDIIVDIGAGTGSLSIEAAILAKKGRVYAVEKNKEGIELIDKNRNRFNLGNISIIEGAAPEILNQVPTVNKAILGGTGGSIVEIFDWLDHSLASKGRVVINVITIENLSKAIENLKKRNYKDIDIVQITISKGKELGSLTMMQGQNPIYVLSGAKG